jgi:hypothetical protein
MATTKQTAIRFRAADIAILEEVQRRTGVISLSEAIRFVIHQYARVAKIEPAKSVPAKHK